MLKFNQPLAGLVFLLYICINKNKQQYNIMKNSAYYTVMANETKIELEAKKAELAKYMGCRPIAKLKKEVDFLLLCDEVKKLQTMWADMITLAINTAKLEKVQQAFN